MKEYRYILENFKYYITTVHATFQSGLDLHQATLRLICTTTDKTAQLKYDCLEGRHENLYSPFSDLVGTLGSIFFVLLSRDTVNGQVLN